MGAGRPACAESTAKWQLTVPAHILQTLAAAGDPGYLLPGAHPLQTPFAAPGPDRGFFVDFSNDSRPVGLRCVRGRNTLDLGLIRTYDVCISCITIC